MSEKSRNILKTKKEKVPKRGRLQEPLAQSFLDHDNPHWREIGCELLVDVGTSASLEKLDTLQSEGNSPQLRNAAAAAAKAIRQREANAMEK